MNDENLSKNLSKLISYLKENKDICWDINDCESCCNRGGNCGDRVRDIIDDIQAELLRGKDK